ncbi:MAG: hypothetical protein ACKOA8_06410 [Deltaproteobacteria bacterium]
MLDKKNIVRLKGILPWVFTVTAGVVTFSASYENCLKTWLETKSSQAYGAKIDIDSVHVELFRGKATLKNIQITNPSEPLKNFATLDTVKIHFNFRDLLKRKLIIESLEVVGLKPLTQRSYSGVLDGLEDLESENHPIFWEKTETGSYAKVRNQIKEGAFKNLSQVTTGAYTLGKLPNPKKTLASLKYLEELTKNFDKAGRDWKRQANLLPSPAQLNQWHAEVTRWNEPERGIASLPSDLMENRRKVASTLREKHDSLIELLKEANKSLSEFKGQMEELNPLLNQDIETVKKELNLPSSEENDLSVSLYGLQVVSFLERLAFWSNAYRNHGKVISRKPGYELVRIDSPGKTVFHFLNQRTSPSVHIKTGAFSQSESGTQEKKIYGSLTDFMLFAHFYKKHFTLSLEATLPEIELEGLKFNIGTAQNDGVPIETFDISFDSFPITNISLRRTPDFDIKIANATARMNFSGKFEGPKLEAKGQFEATGAKFQIQSQFQPFEEVLEELTKYRTSLLVDGNVTAEGDTVDIRLESDFGKKLASSIKETFSKQISQIDETLRAHLLDSLFPLRQSFNDTLQDVENVSLAQMRNTLNELENLVGYTRKYEPKIKRQGTPQAG